MTIFHLFYDNFQPFSAKFRQSSTQPAPPPPRYIDEPPPQHCHPATATATASATATATATAGPRWRQAWSDAGYARIVVPRVRRF
jgi:hypothetical protein